MVTRLAVVLSLLVVALLASGCATRTTAPPGLAGDAPWWESAAPCRIWVPNEPLTSERLPAWVSGTPVMRMSHPGDCRALQAGLRDGTVLIGSD